METEEYIKMRSTCLKYYSRKEIQEAISQSAKNREIGVMYPDKSFGKRPEVLNFAGDVFEFAKTGVTSFHISEERWSNPLQLSTSMRRPDLDALRTGWDLVIDVDGKTLEFSAEAADLIIKALKYHGINAISCKFSGNKGFHIGVPYESFPKMVKSKETSNWFPEGARAVAIYLKEMIRQHLSARILEKNTLPEIQQITNLQFEELVQNNTFNPYSVLELDTILISSRHLFRSPYSLNEKSGLVSIPIEPDKILQFKKENAKPHNTRVSKIAFLDRTKSINDEAKMLLIQAMDFSAAQEAAQKEKEQEKQKRRHETMKHAASAAGYEQLTTAVPTMFFPPCIQKILEGISDGRKRSVFVLTNYLTSLAWNYEEIEALLSEWNKKNETPLRNNYIETHIRYHKTQKKKILPPNCANTAYYKDLGVCNPDALCAKIKNPVNYALIKKRRRTSK